VLVRARPKKAPPARSPAGLSFKVRLRTQRRVAEEAGVKELFITRLIHSAANCTFDTAGRILFALGVRAELKEAAPPASPHTKVAASAGHVTGRNGERKAEANPPMKRKRRST
jgi:hypothetical protein